MPRKEKKRTIEDLIPELKSRTFKLGFLDALKAYHSLGKEIMANEIFSFDQGDLGKIMPDAKKYLGDGKVIIVWGVSEATVDNGEFDVAARSLFWNLPTDERAFEGDDYWGLLLAENSLPIRDTLKMVERNRVPFVAHISQRPKVNSKGQSYWVLKKAELQYNNDGSVRDPNV